jgi:hypothetical protein
LFGVRYEKVTRRGVREDIGERGEVSWWECSQKNFFWNGRGLATAGNTKSG